MLVAMLAAMPAATPALSCLAAAHITNLTHLPHPFVSLILLRCVWRFLPCSDVHTDTHTHKSTMLFGQQVNRYCRWLSWNHVAIVSAGDAVSWRGVRRRRMRRRRRREVGGEK